MSHSLTNLRFAAFCAWVDIRNLFARTRLGTLWNSIGLFIIIAAIGVFFGAILKGELTGYGEYIPFLATGILVWAFLSVTINESCSVFGTRAQVLRHTAYPFAATPLILMLKNLFILVQNMFLAMIVYVLFFWSVEIDFLSLLPGLFLVAVNVLWISLLAAIACTRFRDLPQLVSGTLHLGFFLTPIIWQEHFLGRYIFLVELNPFYHLVSLVRLPLLGIATPTATWV
ncbi:MAG: ABC transporter permease, partial [Rhodospirillales bacterium]